MTLRSLAVRALPLGLGGALVAVVLVARPVPVDDTVEPAILNETRVEPVETVAPADDADDPADEDHDHDESHGHDHGSHGAVVARLDRTDVEPFSMVGVTWAGDQGDYAVEVSYRRDGVWSEPEELHIEGDEAAEAGRPGTEPLWVGDDADGITVSVRSSSGQAPRDVKVATIDPNGTPTIASTAGVVGQPAIISRSQWGASGGSSCDSPIYGASTRGAVIHHTAGSNSYSKSQAAGIVKSTQAYHTGSRKWCDIGYNFLVDKYGQIFEGRKGGIDKQVRGAHAGNGPVNEQTVGVSLMGHFVSTTPSAAMKNATVDLVAWRFGLAGLQAKGTYKLGGKTLNRIAGHRNVVSTACPGEKAYAWLSAPSGLRDRVADVLANGSGVPAPTGVKVTDYGTTSLGIGWDPSPAAADYQVKISESSAMSDASYLRTPTPSATASGLRPFTNYWYRVGVMDESGKRISPYTGAAHRATTDPDLEATSSTHESLRLSWAAAPGAKGYQVKISKNASMSSASYKTFGATTSGTFAGLDPDTTYYVKIGALDSDGDRYTSLAMPPLTAETTKVGAGSGGVGPLDLKQTSVSSSGVGLSWSSFSGASDYQVKWSKSSSMSSPSYKTFGSTSGTVSGLAANTTYYVKVAGLDSSGKRISTYAGAALVVKTDETGASEGVGPLGLKETAVSTSSVGLSWSSFSGASDYKVKWSKSSSMSSPSYKTFGSTSGTVSGLAANTTYYVKVAGLDSSGKRISTYAGEALVVKTDETGASEGVGPLGLEETASSSSSVGLSWSSFSGASDYQVKWSRSSSMSSPSYKTFGSTSGTVSGLAANTTYYVKVAGLDSSGKRISTYAGEALVVKTDAAGAPTGVGPLGLKETAVSTSSVGLSWSSFSGASDYQVKWSRSSSMSSPSYKTFGSTSGTVSGLAANTTYYVKVAGLDSSGKRISTYAGEALVVKTKAGSASSAKNTITVPSTRKIAFKGHGYGHGIGMSQHGAEGGARDGASYRQILNTYYPGTDVSKKSGDIRVLISADTSDSVLIEAKSGIVFRQGDTKITLPTEVGGDRVKRWMIVQRSSNAKQSVLQYRTGSAYKTYKSMVWTGDAQFEASTLELVTPAGNRVYRDTLRSALPSPGSTARNTVNVLSIENYTRGVVAREMPSSWHREALKAQSVAARTYGVRGLNSSRYYDMCDTTSCQVYGGVAAETSATDAAISATAGEILTYKGSPALTQFSSSSGGYTNVGSQPYLKAVPDPWDGWSGNKNHDWTITVSAATIEKKYSSIGTLKSLTVTDRNGHGDMGGRVDDLKLVGSKGTKTISGVDARWAFGLRSDWFGF